jgi:Uma2 family endonuclease
LSALPLEQEVDYPTSDGQPMAESQDHAKVMMDLFFCLQLRYKAVADAWEGINFFLFYEKGNPKARVSPDVMLAKGVARWDRQNYLLWKERPPSLIVEVTSRKTRRKDTGPKKDLYERIGVEEYILFDPLGEYLRPQLQGYRLLRGRYQPIPLSEDGALLSRTTGLRMRPEGRRLRLIDAATGEPLLWSEETDAALREAEAALREAEAVRREAEAARREEEAARREAEARIRALEEELKRIRGV